MNVFCLCPGRTGRVSRLLLMIVVGLVVASGQAAVAAFGDEAEPSKPIASQPVKVQVSENWTIEIVPGPVSAPALAPRPERIAPDEAQQKIQPVPHQRRGNKATNDCSCCTPRSTCLTQADLNKIMRLVFYYDNQSLSHRGRWRP